MARTKRSITVAELVNLCQLPRTLYPTWNVERLNAFEIAQQIYKDRVEAYDVDHPPYEEMVYGPVSFASELFKRARRLASLLSPMRKDPLRPADVNRILDVCVDMINYLSWLYALIVVASKFRGHANGDDSVDYLEMKGKVEK